nr:hypothetical protein [Tanacetum cinerariifolium]
PSSGTPLLLPISASTSSPPLQLPSASGREDRHEVTLPPRKKLAGGLRADYGFVATMDREIMHDPERETQVTALQGQQGLARGPTQPELPEEAGSGS